METAMIKTLTRLGNSNALIFDRTLMNLMEIDGETPLKLTVEGRRLIVEPLSDEERARKFQKVARRVIQKNSELLKRLAK
jgi:antitoxin component of MazEF toxin-antitoxin module